MSYSRLQVFRGDIADVGLSKGSNLVKAGHMRKRKRKNLNVQPSTGKTWYRCVGCLHA